MATTDYVNLPVLVGRTREIEILERALKAAINGTGSCILLAGEAGIGKSRLAAELSNVATHEHFLILYGYCSEQDISFPYAPWIDALRSFLASPNAGQANDLLNTFAPELVKLLPELSLLLPKIQSTTPLEPEAEKHRLFETIDRFVTSLTATQPLLIILEDLHWSDELSLELFSFFARRISSFPILILGTYRSEDESPRLAHFLAELNRNHLVEEIQLAPLVRQEVSQMAQEILKTEAPLSSKWLDMLMPLTEGNPLFVEEITKSLVQAGGTPGRWDPSHIPSSIQHIVQSKAAKLSERTRRILSLASVIGERFDFTLLQEISSENEQSLLRMMKELSVDQLIIEQSADQFAFRHALTREVIYSTLLLRERKAIHKIIGETLEHYAQMQARAPAAPLAYHFYQAGEWRKAMEFSQKAGEKALALYAPREALTHFSHALEAAKQLNAPIPIQSLRGRAQASSILGDFDGALADYQVLIETAQQSEDHLGEWQALIDLGLSWQPHDLLQAGKYFQDALELARKLEDDSVLARSLNRLGNWLFFQGRSRQALAHHHEALRIFQSLADHRGMAETLGLLGLASYGIGEIIQGVAYYEQALPLLREVDDRQGLVLALDYLSLRARFDTEILGDMVLSQLARHSQLATEIAQSFDWREGEGIALSRSGICWSRVGEYERGLELLKRAQVLGEEIEHRHMLTSIHLNIGELYLGIFETDLARHHLDFAFGLAQEVGALQLVRTAQPPLVSTCIRQGDLSHAKAVLAVLPHTDDVNEIDSTGMFERLWWSAQAELELASGNAARALEIVDRLIGSAQNLAQFGPRAIPWLSKTRAQALVMMDRPEEAVDDIIGAQFIARAWGALPLLWRLQADLGKVYRILGRRADARQEFQAARTVINNLATHVPEGDLRENFLQRALSTIPAEHVPTESQAAKIKFGGLTTREREVAALIAQGKSNRDIADELNISEKTAERHVANILLKLGFNVRTQIAAWVVEKGLKK